MRPVETFRVRTALLASRSRSRSPPKPAQDQSKKMKEFGGWKKSWNLGNLGLGQESRKRVLAASYAPRGLGIGKFLNNFSEQHVRLSVGQTANFEGKEKTSAIEKRRRQQRDRGFSEACGAEGTQGTHRTLPKVCGSPQATSSRSWGEWRAVPAKLVDERVILGISVFSKRVRRPARSSGRGIGLGRGGYMPAPQ